jgi:hypothetical protein
MAASPLAAAMLGGGGESNAAAMMAMDPSMMTAMPDMQLGQSMIQQGMSTAPASPWQALARVAQAGAGTYLQHSALSSLAQAYAHTADNAADTLPEGHPLRAALQSKDPMVRMQGLQAYQKALTLMSEPSNISGGEQRVIGNQPIFTSNQPTSPEGKVQADVNRFNGQPAVPPPRVPQGPPVLAPQGPQGPQAGPPVAQRPAGVPLNAPQTGGIESVVGMGPGSPAGGLNFNDRFAASRPSGVPSTSAPTSPLQGAIDLDARKATATESAKAGVEYGDLLGPQPEPKKGPGGTEPLTTTHGTLVPPLSEQGQLPKSPAEAKPAVETWRKTQDGWNAGLQPGYQAEQRLNTIAQTFKTMQTGYGADQKAKVAALMKSIGVTLPESILGDPAKVETAIHENYVETLQQLKATTPRFTQMEFRALSENKEHPNLQPEANLTMLSEDIGQLRQARDLPRDFVEAQQHGWRDPQSFEQAWLRQNPLKGYVDKVRGEIGPLKGMPGNETGAKSAFPGATPQSPTAPQISSKADYDALAKGAPYMAPDGSIRHKQ